MVEIFLTIFESFLIQENEFTVMIKTNDFFPGDWIFINFSQLKKLKRSA
jgi:hypothetical protein